MAGKAAGKILAARLRGTGSKHPYIKRDGRHEHRVVAEETLGRPLLPGELVHHRDEHGKNNAPTNLQVTDRPEHARIHFTGSKQSPEHVRKRVESARRTRAANAAARQPA
ncbi:MAG: hypothetical protein JWQ97_988 [Phenylobacterium sp.]|nr:hypothetical protein [Phenylobacterium sp.]